MDVGGLCGDVVEGLVGDLGAEVEVEGVELGEVGSDECGAGGGD